MSKLTHDWATDVLFLEYEKLKDEQNSRIQYRDHMVHVHLAMVGAAGAWALGSQSYVVLLVIPWMCLILGWAYIVNDEKISAIGLYIRESLHPRLSEQGNDQSFLWERVHRSDGRRLERKVLQHFFDQVQFSLSGMLAVVLVLMSGELSGSEIVACCFEFILMMALAVLLFRYTDFSRDSPC